MSAEGASSARALVQHAPQPKTMAAIMTTKSCFKLTIDPFDAFCSGRFHSELRHEFATEIQKRLFVICFLCVSVAPLLHHAPVVSTTRNRAFPLIMRSY